MHIMNGPSFISRYTRGRLNCEDNLGSLLGAGIFFVILFASYPVLAHGFAYKYDLPLPLNLYVIGSSSIVFISFLMLLFLVL